MYTDPPLDINSHYTIHLYYKDISDNINHMDDLANLYWTVILIFFIFLFFGVVSIILGLISAAKKIKGLPPTLRSNLLMVGISYLVLATTFYFIKPWGEVFSFFFLPVLSVITLIILELLTVFKKG